MNLLHRLLFFTYEKVYPMTQLLILSFICLHFSGEMSFGVLTTTSTDTYKALNVGENLLRETLPFEMGSRLYRLNGLKSSTWYEVKISYPASIPASFSIQLICDKSDIAHNWNRRLLNTEKLVFKADNNDIPEHQKYVLVSVEPAGVVAIPGAKERELVPPDELVTGYFTSEKLMVWSRFPVIFCC
ncbi:hypothetical protein MKX03_005148 [Papaver bracteatum]|nr:hypothetical protein MKX03_005148 [Papaver bracteatum]